MMNTLRLLRRQNAHQLRRFHNCIVHHTEVAVATPTKSATILPPAEEMPIDQKIDKIANDITALNLIEVALLSDLLKKRLNLPDAPAMSLGGFITTSSAEDPEEITSKAVKSSFTVTLKAFDDKQKVALIKEIKNILPDTNLVQAKKFVESAPVIVRADISQAEADELKASIEKVGGTIEIS